MLPKKELLRSLQVNESPFDYRAELILPWSYADVSKWSKGFLLLLWRFEG